MPRNVRPFIPTVNVQYASQESAKEESKSGQANNVNAAPYMPCDMVSNAASALGAETTAASGLKRTGLIDDATTFPQAPNTARNMESQKFALNAAGSSKAQAAQRPAQFKFRKKATAPITEDGSGFTASTFSQQ